MTADAEQVSDRATEALDQVPTLGSALGCMDCERIFRFGPRCPYCTSQSLLNVSDCIGDQHIAAKMNDARESITRTEE